MSEPLPPADGALLLDGAQPPRGALLIDGVAVASESGRTYPVHDAQRHVLAHLPLANRRDVRDAVAGAVRAAPGWAATDPFERAETMYRVEAVLTARHEELVDAVAAAENLAPRRAVVVVEQAVERWLHYAGWADKLGAAQPDWIGAGGPAPRPTGVAGVLAPQRSSLLGPVSVLAPALTAGNAVVLVAAHDRPLPTVLLAQACVAGGVASGVLGVLTGRTAELAPWLAAHPDVDALDLCGAPAALAPDLELAAAGTVKRVMGAPAAEPDWTRPPGLHRLHHALR